ncbi:transposase [Pseudomonas putida]|jgi:DNA invertase Pin-like site-specific DNA recombinase|uniref:Transposase n=1 Tax=Pseudomonas putida TaxID=303 RepID=A0A7U6M2V0_PSEPU|nr:MULTISPECIES: recombinase family protein [Pseudomonas]MDD2124168.1 recombinase family protein [Pseudomonas monteilii]BBU44965.1 transposase [Pseudomonas putida]
MDIGYIRVSSTDQNTARQLDGVTLDQVFTDKVSGSTVERPELALLRRSLRAGDTLHVHSIDRLARSLSDLLGLVEEFRGKGVILRFHKENLTFTGQTDPMQDLMLSMMGAVAQFERAIIRERQAEGIAKAKEAGVYERRTAAKGNAAIMELRDSGMSIRAIAQKLGIGVSTVQRALKG